MWDVIVVGAGISGLTAAQQLSQAGYRVLVLDKSRGLGGRMATRRVTRPADQGADKADDQTTTVAVDHGCRFIQPSARLGEDWLAPWVAQGLVQPWTPTEFILAADGLHNTPNSPSNKTSPPYYVAPQGMSSLGKALATGLTVQRQCRVTQVWPEATGWRVDWVATANEAAPTTPLTAQALILALPAAQIVPLVASAAAQNESLCNFLAAAAAVTFDPVITVMAGYNPTVSADLGHPNPSGWLVAGQGHPVLRWLALDSSKRPNPPYPVVVAHSTAPFAEAHFEAADLAQIGQDILAQAAQGLEPWLATPDWMQVHRWRYGFVKRAHPAKVLYTEAVSTLAGCGDWCAGATIEDAVLSGQTAARRITQALAASGATSGDDQV